MSVRAGTPNCPGGGGTSLAQAGEAYNFLSGSAYAQAQVTCPPNQNAKTVLTQTSKSLMSVDNSTLIMNKSSIEAMSESINQMIVNSVTSTTSTLSQTVNVTQAMKINASNIKGDVYIGNVNQTATIDLSNVCNMDMTAIDNVRTDLATQVLDQFSTNSNAEAITAAQTSIDKELQATTEAALKERNDSAVSQEFKSANAPLPMPPTILSTNPAANTTTEQYITQDTFNATSISQPFTLSTDIKRTIKNKIVNAVTQNFTHETVTQLMQTANVNQALGINAENIGGKLTIENISQATNVVLRQTLSANMNIGLSIMNDFKNDMGIITDDTQSAENNASASGSDTSGLRGSGSFSSDIANTFSYTQKVTASGSSGSGSSGSSGSFISSCIIVVLLCVAGPMLGSLTSLIPEGGSETDSSSRYSNTSTSSDSSTSSE